MNYTQTKDLCVSRFIDFSNENASPCFCFKSVVQSLNQTIFFMFNLVFVKLFTFMILPTKRFFCRTTYQNIKELLTYILIIISTKAIFLNIFVKFITQTKDLCVFFDYSYINLRDSEYYIIHNISPQCFKMIKEVVFD